MKRTGRVAAQGLASAADYRTVRCAEEQITPFPAGGCYGGLPHLPIIRRSYQPAGLEAALDQPLARILEQVQLALDSAREKPDVIYLTGTAAPVRH